MNDERKAIYWGAEDQEQLTHEDVDEAIEEMLDDTYPGPLSGKLKVCGYARMEMEVPDILENLLESLDEEYGDPDGGFTEPTPGMIFAANTLADTIKREYRVWMCEVVETREIDVAEWVLANRPNWIKGARRG